MRQFISLRWVLLVGLALTQTVFALDESHAWNEFKKSFNRSYASESEEERRMNIFLDNLRYVESHNTKSTSSSFKQGLGPLSDLTTEEINRSRNGFRWAPQDDTQMPISELFQSMLAAFNESAIESRAWYENLLSRPSLDWRESGRVSKVKDQGSCGSCWSFATTGALESILASRGKATLLSEQNLVDCSRAYGNYGCSGGLMDAALRYVRDYGIMQSSDYAYTGKDESCKYDRSKVILRVRGSATLPHGNEALLRLALATMGPIPVAIDASARAFHNYKSGVYDDTECSSSSRALNHAVLLVGYGTDRNYGDYWIVKNSWGSKWGDSGYFKLARNRHNLCGIASYAVVPIPR